MLKTVFVKHPTDQTQDRWSIYFTNPNPYNQWVEDFIGDVYPNTYGGYDMFYVTPPRFDIVKISFGDQRNLMGFLAYLGWELRRKESR